MATLIRCHFSQEVNFSGNSHVLIFPWEVICSGMLPFTTSQLSLEVLKSQLSWEVLFPKNKVSRKVRFPSNSTFFGRWLRGIQLSREVIFPGKLPFPRGQISRKVKFSRSTFPGSSLSWEGSPLSWEVHFPGKTTFLGRQISWEVNFLGKTTFPEGQFLGSQLTQKVNFLGSQLSQEVNFPGKSCAPTWERCHKWWKTRPYSKMLP